MRKTSLFWFAAALLGAALIFSGCEGETTTETNTVFVSYDEVTDDPDDLQEYLETLSRVAYTGTDFSATGYGGSVTVPAGKTLGLLGTIATGTLVVNGTVNVEIKSTLSDVTGSSVITTGEGGFIVVRKGGKFETDKAVASLPGGLSVTGGVLEYAAAGSASIADGGSITALLGKVSSGKLIIGSTSIGPVAIAAAATGLSENKTLAATTSVAIEAAGTESFTVPAYLTLSVPDLVGAGDVTVSGSGSLVFTGGGLILTAGKAFTLNDGGYVSGGSIVAGSTTIDGSWSGSNTAAVITATSGSSSTIRGVLLSGYGGGTISQGTGATNRLDIQANTEIYLDVSGFLVLYGTEGAAGTGAVVHFAAATSKVYAGNVGGVIFQTGTLSYIPGGSITSEGLNYATASGTAGSLAYIAGSQGAGSLSASGTTATLEIWKGTPIN